eukprot:scaffold37718_cov60-Phaeocystis_antarctica.AAC.1
MMTMTMTATATWRMGRASRTASLACARRRGQLPRTRSCRRWSRRTARTAGRPWPATFPGGWASSAESGARNALPPHRPAPCDAHAPTRLTPTGCGCAGGSTICAPTSRRARGPRTRTA